MRSRRAARRAPRGRRGRSGSRSRTSVSQPSRLEPAAQPLGQAGAFVQLAQGNRVGIRDQQPAVTLLVRSASSWRRRSAAARSGSPACACQRRQAIEPPGVLPGSTATSCSRADRSADGSRRCAANQAPRIDHTSARVRIALGGISVSGGWASPPSPTTEDLLRRVLRTQPVLRDPRSRLLIGWRTSSSSGRTISGSGNYSEPAPGATTAGSRSTRSRSRCWPVATRDASRKRRRASSSG